MNKIEQKERLLSEWRKYDSKKLIKRYITGDVTEKKTLEDFSIKEIKKHLKDYIDKDLWDKDLSDAKNFECSLFILSPFDRVNSWKHYEKHLESIIRRLVDIQQDLEEFNNFRTQSIVTGNYPNDEIIVIDNISYHLEELFESIKEF